MRGGNVDNQPRVAKKKPRKIATRGQLAEVVSLDAERNKRQKSQQHSAATRGRKTLRKKQPHVAGGNPYVEAVKASKGTWAFRLRWRSGGQRSKPVYLSRVADPVYEMIREGNYEAFKEQLVASHFAGAVRAGNTA